MDSKFKVKMNPLVIGAILLQVIFVVLLAVVFGGFAGPDAEIPKVEVSSLSNNIRNLPEFGAEDIEHSIYLAIENNTHDGIIQKKGINIREGSLIEKNYDDLGLHYLNFIVDVPDVEQSYRVVVKWEDGGQGDVLYDNMSGVVTGVLCLDDDELVYGDFGCKPYREYLRYAILYSLLTSGAESIDGDITLIPEYEGGENNLKVKIVFSNCSETQCICKISSSAERNTAAKEFADLVRQLGLDADSVPYYFDNCSNEYMWVDESGVLRQR